MYHPHALKTLKIGKRHNSNFQISQNGVIFFILYKFCQERVSLVISCPQKQFPEEESFFKELKIDMEEIA